MGLGQTLRNTLLIAGLSIPTLGHAQDAQVDLTPLLDLDTSVLIGDCKPANALAEFMVVIECGENNPVISIVTGMAPDYAIDFSTDTDIAGRCAKTAGCISATSLSLNGWTGGRDFHAGDFGNVADTLLVSGPSSIQIASRALDDETAKANADIILNVLGDLVLCAPWEGDAPDCPVSR